jgi:hypothetical protein
VKILNRDTGEELRVIEVDALIPGWKMGEFVVEMWWSSADFAQG